MAYLDPRAHFRIAGRVRDWFTELNKRAESAPSWQERVYSDVGNFLIDNRLDPTPDNYDLAYQFRAASNAQLVSAVRSQIEASGALDAETAEQIFAQLAGPVSAEALADFAKRIEDQASGLATIAHQSRRDVGNFRAALEKECAQGVEPSSILDLTQAMASRTRLAEAQLRHAQKELTGLKTTLVEAQRAADVDPLTELPNRRAFKRDLETMIDTARHSATPLSLGFCDIDHFKAVNDSYGHETGDRVLRYVATTLSREFEQHGCVGRFGGEEFVVALPGHALGDARRMIDDARERLSQRHLYAAADHADLGTVTFSAGVTTMVDGDGTAELLRRADEALYRAKGSGRNCVVIG